MPLSIGKKKIGRSHPCYIIAEISANHGQSYDRAVELVKAAKKAGADAVKLQTYLPETMTLRSDKPWFKISGTLWEGEQLYDLYEKAYTPWEWYEDLNKLAQDLTIDLFSSPFDFTAVDFLEGFAPPAYKIASFENVDLPLIEKIAQTGRTTIMSTGMASVAEIEEAVATFRNAGGTDLVLLHCISAYPSPVDAMNLAKIPYLAEKFGVVSGLSDHSLDPYIPVAAVALGAKVIEKHFTLSRTLDTADRAFSLEPEEFANMVTHVRSAEAAIGSDALQEKGIESPSRQLRRSLFIVKDVQKGAPFSQDNIRSIRPANGLHTRYYHDVLGKHASRDIEAGTPLSFSLIREPLAHEQHGYLKHKKNKE